MLKDYIGKIYTDSQTAFHALADQALEQQRKLFIVTANPETLMLGQSNAAFDAILRSPDTIIVPDGIGVIKALDLLGIASQGRIPGVELAEHLIDTCGKTGKRIYLYGAKEEIVRALAEKIQQQYGQKVLCGYRNGYGQDDETVFAEIAALQPDLILVALGVPHQEMAIHQHLSLFQRGIFIGVGGSFDVLSGSKKRAPQIFIRLNLEWLYRIVKEPKRLKRFYDSNVRFLGQIRKMRQHGN